MSWIYCICKERGLPFVFRKGFPLIAPKQSTSFWLWHGLLIWFLCALAARPTTPFYGSLIFLRLVFVHQEATQGPPSVLTTDTIYSKVSASWKRPTYRVTYSLDRWCNSIAFWQLFVVLDMLLRASNTGIPSSAHWCELPAALLATERIKCVFNVGILWRTRKLWLFWSCAQNVSSSTRFVWVPIRKCQQNNLRNDGYALEIPSSLTLSV